jgi:hypothetical protein
MFSDYDVYKVFKEVENEEKGKNTKILDEDSYNKRVSENSRDALRQSANLFNTKFSNIELKEYVRCGFCQFKSFNYDKMFRDVVINEYISRDSRKKRNSQESLKKVMDDLKFIDRPLESYILEVDNNQKMIIKDYLLNRIGSTILVYCIWRNLFHPDNLDWEYMNTIKNNYPVFEKNVVKFASLIDKWRISMREKR